MTDSTSTQQQNPLIRMRRIATAALVVVFCGMIGFRWMEPWHPALGYLRAFCEAATVGALADWFAVVALFRHPMGIPIPHTAILPNSRGRVAESLATFIDQNFLDEKSIYGHIQRLDFAAIAARALRAHRSDLLAMMLDATDRWLTSTSARDVSPSMIASCTGAISKIDISDTASRALEAIFSGSRGEAIQRLLLQSATRVIVENRGLIQEKIRAELPLSGELVRGLPGGQHLAPAIDQIKDQISAAMTERAIEKIQHLLKEAADDHTHPLRQFLDSKMAQWIAELQTSPDLRARLEAMKSQIFSTQESMEFPQHVWESIRSGVLSDLRDPNTSTVRDLLAQGLDGVIRALAENESIKSTLNRLVAGQITSSLPDLRVQLRAHIQRTIMDWNPEDISEKLESTVGRDLQFIRLNGTLIGGFIGVLIHAGFAIVGI